MDASVANWWNGEEYAVDINEEDLLISIESVDHSITMRAEYENRDASSDINNNVFSAKDLCRQRGPPSVMRMQSGSNRTVATRLEELEDLLRQGLISKEERETKRADILSSL